MDVQMIQGDFARKSYLIVYSRNVKGTGVSTGEIEGDLSLCDLIEELKSGKINIKKCELLYIHFNDFNNPDYIGDPVTAWTAWTEVTSLSKQYGIQLFFFTTGSTFKYNPVIRNSDQYIAEIIVFPWTAIEDILGLPDHPRHQVPKPTTNITSLFILCQGYLVVHAKYTGMRKSWDNQVMEQALNVMDWKKLNEDPNFRSLVSCLGTESNLDDVRKSLWWRTAFTNDLLSSLKLEWHENKYGTLPKKFELLVELIISNGMQIDDPKLVSEVYCLIAERLGR